MDTGTALFVGGSGALVLKIVWDFIKTPHSEIKERRANCERQKATCDIKFVDLTNKVGALSVQIATNMTEAHERQKSIDDQLKNGREEFKEVKKDIKDMSMNLAALLAISRSQTKDKE